MPKGKKTRLRAEKGEEPAVEELPQGAGLIRPTFSPSVHAHISKCLLCPDNQDPQLTPLFT